MAPKGYVTSLLAVALGLAAGYYALEKRVQRSWLENRREKGPKVVRVDANLNDGICGLVDVEISRLPLGTLESKSLPMMLQIVHPRGVISWTDERCWDTALLVSTSRDSKQYTKISRATLMTLFAITNARPIFKYSSASGHRASYPSYCGIWNIEWPIGQPATATLSPHDSHTVGLDVYPPTLKVRVDKCIEMLAGVISFGTSKVAFPGRAKDAGPFRLEFRKLGFPGSHGARHLYNMVGGKVFEVDLFALKRTDLGPQNQDCREFSIRCLDPNHPTAKLFVPPIEFNILAKALDHLPWSSLSWSLNRGLRDILLAFGSSVMDVARPHLAQILKSTIVQHPEQLISQGWNEDFVRGPMPDLAASSILAAGGNSGDMVRVVVAAAEVFCGNIEESSLNQTHFWQKSMETALTGNGSPRIELSTGHIDDVIALTKFFVLEWSTELDYQLYHDIPMEVLLT
ncbi:hypothetical protein BP6252_14139 [Coleophoma cylindrospora]|uniref:Uncharacterized protein n=1 Tax=Coleophoma cylindrospora TaxID=1849047 RepID=A0A3D8Q3K3_9HELO|nr:hypothetical protein BP6252_14139 [Coleophoma cylindrospora]